MEQKMEALSVVENFLLYLIISFIEVFCRVFFKYKRVNFSFSSLKSKDGRNWEVGFTK